MSPNLRRIALQAARGQRDGRGAQRFMEEFFRSALAALQRAKDKPDE